MTAPVVVVGAGILGSAIAWQLQDRGVPVVLVDRGERPRGASSASLAGLTALDEPLSELYALKCLGISHWRRWQRELGTDIGVAWDGEIRWAEAPESAHLLKTMVDRALYRGYPVQRLTKAELTERLPDGQPGDVLEASAVDVDGQADPPKAIAALRERFKSLGGTFSRGPVSLSLGDSEMRVVVGDDAVEAGRVVVTTGAETARLLGRLGYEVAMQPSPGLLAVTEPMPPVVKGSVYVYPSVGVPVHLRQRSDGSVVVGEQSQEHVTDRPTDNHARELVHQAARSFPRLATAALSHFTVEWRPTPADGMPIVGALPGLPEVHVATAHSGVTLAPALAALVAQELIDGQPAEQLAQFRPDRLAVRRPGVANRVEAAFSRPAEIILD